MPEMSYCRLATSPDHSAVIESDLRVVQELRNLALQARTPEKFNYLRMKIRQNILPLAGDWQAVVEPLLFKSLDDESYWPGDSRLLLLCACLLDICNDFVQFPLLDRICVNLQAGISRSNEPLSIILWVGLISANVVRPGGDDACLQTVEHAFDWAAKCQAEVQLWPLFSIMHTTLLMRGYFSLASEFAFACYHLAYLADNESWLQRSRYAVVTASMRSGVINSGNLGFDYGNEITQFQGGQLIYDIGAQVTLALGYSRLATRPAMFDAEAAKYRLRMAEEIADQFTVKNQQQHLIVKGLLAHACDDRYSLLQSLEDLEYLYSKGTELNYLQMHDLSSLRQMAGKELTRVIGPAKQKGHAKWLGLRRYLGLVFH